MRPFDPSTDLAVVRAWAEAYGQAAPLISEALPPTGFIEPGLAAGFLVKTDVGCAYLEGFVGNPGAPKEARGDALEAIADRLLAIAKADGIRVVLAVSEHPSILARVARRGFREVGRYTIMAIGI